MNINAGVPALEISGIRDGWRLPDGSIVGFSSMQINIDGSNRAYHRNNAQAGALLHLCNAGRVYLPDGSSYEGSESNKTCTGKFMRDIEKIENSGWNDPSVGLVSWYGILGQGSATIQGKKINRTTPVLQADGSGFYVSTTSLADKSILDHTIQERYLDPLRIPFAALPNSLKKHDIELGSFGVAYHKTKRIAVPFIVGDGAPRVGEGSVALARLAAGLPLTDAITYKDRYAGQVSDPDILWVYFGDTPIEYNSKQVNNLLKSANAAFSSWGGQTRLEQCLQTVLTSPTRK